MKNVLSISIICLLQLVSCAQQEWPVQQPAPNKGIVVGAERMERYLPLLSGKNVAVIANPTSRVSNAHLVDTLLAMGVQVKKVFAPEHGFRGEAAAGETIKDGHDRKTGLQVVSLYGKNKKPTPESLNGIDVIVFDIQDVGARFYTYISTMHYAMEAAAENNIKMILLDRPNPNGFYIDGPVLDKRFSSFVGMHPIPIVHGCTVGELARMINGEKWLSGGISCNLEVITCDRYTHDDLYDLPVKPSPNLPNMSSVYLYPTLCLFEGTEVSVGRGTDLPFQCIGYPGNTTGTYHFTPHNIPGVATDPPHKGIECTGHNVSEFGSFYFYSSRQLYLDWLVGLYKESKDKTHFFSSSDFFDKLAGTDILRKQIIEGADIEDIRKSWEPGLEQYRLLRKKYLLYPDFH
ncbi:MAG: DUF1343 domain-containing protein [Crocinitomicaceae bacterium]|nr:DUF1343 domain-containing protein [Crocinitomicaceae bacterium]